MLVNLDGTTDLELDHDTEENSFAVINAGKVVCEFTFGDCGFTIAVNDPDNKNILRKYNYITFEKDTITIVDDKPEYNLEYTLDNVLSAFKRLSFRIK